MQYRRAKTPGATDFFTVVTHQRQKLFQHLDFIETGRIEELDGVEESNDVWVSCFNSTDKIRDRRGKSPPID